MIIPFVFDDGGRKDSIYANTEKLDCGVRALAIALNLPYAKAHTMLKNWGRKDRHKTYKMDEFVKTVLMNKFPNRIIVHENINITLSKFVNQYYRGIFMLYRNGHFFAVKDGVVYDTFSQGGKSKIRWFVEIKPESTPII